MSNISQLLAVKDIGDGQYQSTHSGHRRHTNDGSAYGGFAIGIGIRAAFASLPTSRTYHIYSALGNFLGPALSGVDSICTVRSTRDTKTFASRFVEIKQQIRGAWRTVMTILCDFQAAEPPMMEYSAPPQLPYKNWSEIETVHQRRQTLVNEGKLTQQQADRHAQGMSLQQLFDTRPCPEGILAQNMYGFGKHAATTQDGRAITAKTTAEWVKIRADAAAATPAEHASAMAFLMDGYLAFLPLGFTNRFLEDCGTAGSLEFALRFFRTGDEVDFNKWHLRESHTIAAAHGRTYSEARMWDESGNLVCNMTQQSILRPKKAQEKL